MKKSAAIFAAVAVTFSLAIQSPAADPPVKADAGKVDPKADAGKVDPKAPGAKKTPNPFEQLLNKVKKLKEDKDKESAKQAKMKKVSADQAKLNKSKLEDIDAKIADTEDKIQKQLDGLTRGKEKELEDLAKKIEKLEEKLAEKVDVKPGSTPDDLTKKIDEYTQKLKDDGKKPDDDAGMKDLKELKKCIEKQIETEKYVKELEDMAGCGKADPEKAKKK